VGGVKKREEPKRRHRAGDPTTGEARRQGKGEDTGGQGRARGEPRGEHESVTYIKRKLLRCGSTRWYGNGLQYLEEAFAEAIREGSRSAARKGRCNDRKGRLKSVLGTVDFKQHCPFRKGTGGGRGLGETDANGISPRRVGPSVKTEGHKG